MSVGETRVEVRIAGDAVVDSSRFVHVPEEWERSERNRAGAAQVAQILCVVVMVLVFVAGAVFAIVRWARHRFAFRTAALSFVLLAVVGLVGLANSWSAITAGFSTAQPYELQAGVTLAGSVLALLGLPAVIALIVGLVHRWLPLRPTDRPGWSLVTGMALGALVAGIGALAAALSPDLDPPWAGFGGAGDALPMISAALDPVQEWLTSTAFALLLFAAVHAATAGWQRRRLPLSLLMVAFGLVLSGAGGVETLPLWLLGGLATGLGLWAVYVLVVRFEPAVVPGLTAAMAVLSTVREGLLGAYPGVLAGSLVGAALVAVLAVGWTKRLRVDMSG